MLDWEKDNIRRHHREYSPDTLPDTGSWRDQRRWERETGATPRCFTRRGSRQNSFVVSSFDLTVKQLNLYIRCVESASFYEKSSSNQNEILCNLRILIRKIQAAKSILPSDIKALINVAQHFLNTFNT